MRQNQSNDNESEQRNGKNPPRTFRVADAARTLKCREFDLSAAMRETLAMHRDPVEIAATLTASELKRYELEVLTPAQLLSRRDDEDYERAIDILSYDVGDCGRFLIDADFIVREIDKGYPVGVVWSTNALADGAERIAYWCGKIDYSNRADMTVCVLTLDHEASYPPAETERREAMVLTAVDKAYWIGDGHPRDVRLTRYADFSLDVCISRNSSLQI